MPVSFKPIIVILAAGLSKRFDGVKLLAKVHHKSGQTPMLQHVLNKVESLELPVVVATGEYHQILQSNTISSADFHFCSSAHLGLGHTISQVTQYITCDYPDSSHIVFLLGDQVALSDSDYHNIISCTDANPSLINYCQTSQGISAPAVFPKAFWSELTQLSGDLGAKQIITSRLKQANAIEIENARFDIDQQDQLIQWNNRFTENAELTNR